MEAFESDNHQQQQQGNDSNELMYIPQQSLLEEAGNLSPTQVRQQESQILDPENIYGDTIGEGKKAQEMIQQDEPHKDSLLYSPEKEDPPSSSVKHNDFDFGKELPSVPVNSQKDEELMNFSNSHFRADDQPLVDDSLTEELMKQHLHEDFNPPKKLVIDDQLNKQNADEDIQPQYVQDDEPVLRSSHLDVAEENVHVPTIPTQNRDEIIVSTSPTSSHRPAPPIPVEEDETEVPELQTYLKSQPSPVLSKKDRPSETIIPTEPVSATKSRSVRSTKTEVTTGHTLLCGWIHLPRLNAFVADLIYWRDPRKSGVVFGAILAILLSLSVVSVVSVVSYSALAVLTGTLSFRLYKNLLQAVQKTQDGHPFKEYLEIDVTIPTEKIHEVADLSAARLNTALLELRRLFLVEDLVDSIKFAILLWCFTYVGSWFNGLTLVILGVMGVFSLPKVYETHQEKIDQNVDIVRGKVNELLEKVQSVLPIGKKSKSQ